MGRRFYRELVEKTDGQYFMDGPPKSIKQIFNRIDRRKLNSALKKDPDDVPARWNHRHWGLWKWY